MSSRYDDLGLLGTGGMGEVRRVRDRDLGRTCAFKAVRPDLAGRPALVARFVDEAKIAAQLQHPNIPPIYDAGRLPDGRPWFTMKEVQGRTLAALMQEASDGGAADTRRLVSVLASVCDAVGYAHGRGVVHRDLKPDNVMLGPHHEVYVLDWGLAKIVGAGEEPSAEPLVARTGDDALRTRAGGVLGTAAYMSPEQARGDGASIGARSDVWALGAILYEILAGRPPYEGRDARAVIRQILLGPPAPPQRHAAGAAITLGFEISAVEDTPSPSDVSEELASLCMRCLSMDPADRPRDGAAVGDELRRWLDGATRRDKALEVVRSADALIERVAELELEAAGLRAEGDRKLAALPAWASEDEKAEAWAAQDDAEACRREAGLLELRREALLQAALTHAPDLTEAHAGLVELEIARHRRAEEARDDWSAARADRQIREHVRALRDGHPTGSRAAAYLQGDGALTLHTDVEGAEVELYRHELRHRRLVPVPVKVLGRTPVTALTLPRGSYLCVIRHPDRVPVRYPVVIGRGEHWDGVPPGATGARPIRLPRLDELDADDIYVPAGWFRCGGDPVTFDGLPARRLWCDDLVVKRFPVTNREFLAFLDDLVATGREDEALRHQPRERAAEGAPIFGRGADGRFVPRPDADGDTWHLDWPAVLVDWPAAVAYARWRAAREGRPWRLPGELEWEKVARGVDGRIFPWGDTFDASWACTRTSHAGRALLQVVDSYPHDVSVYGVRGLGGNTQDWCADAFVAKGPPLSGDEVPVPDDAAPGPRCSRGGHWGGDARAARAADRARHEPTHRFSNLGFRLLFRPG